MLLHIGDNLTGAILVPFCWYATTYAKIRDHQSLPIFEQQVALITVVFGLLTEPTNRGSSHDQRDSH